MIRILPLLSLALAGCASGVPQPAMSVQPVVQQAQALDGREVIVSGWIEECQRLSCPLFAAAEEVDKDRPYILSIGRSRWFDRLAARMARTRMTLRARVNAGCISDPATGIYAVCADRTNDLEPIRLLR